MYLELVIKASMSPVHPLVSIVRALLGKRRWHTGIEVEKVLEVVDASFKSGIQGLSAHVLNRTATLKESLHLSPSFRRLHGCCK